MPTLPLPKPVYPPNDRTKFGAPRTGDRPPECLAGHCGVDLYLPIGTPVRAVASGRVLAARESSNVAGKFIWLGHDGWRSHYVHLDSYNVRQGEHVREGQQIGTLGRTGIKRDRPHLHFALSRKTSLGWKYYDPEPSLRAWATGGILGLVVVGGLVWWLVRRS